MRCAVLGDPVGHSLSPALHRAAYAALGLDDWSYDAVRVEAGGLAAFVAALGPRWRGLSLTMPLKREAPAVADSVAETARRAGAANTLVLDRAGTTVRLRADNTDVPGAAAALRERYAGPVAAAVVLGGGATAASAGLALADLGCRDLTLVVRAPARAEPTAAVLAGHPARPAVRVTTPESAPSLRGHVLVSTVPAAAQTPALLARCAGVPVVFDVVYDPWPTPLAAAVVDDGRTLVSGLDLLAHQAALQVELFTGASVPAEDLRAAGRAALGAA